MLCGIILAAGVSSRMGRFKPMLPVGDTTFIKYQIMKMREAGVGYIVVVTGYRHAELEKHISDEGVITVFNEDFYRTQMLDSVKLGIGSLITTCDRVLLSPVDVAMTPLEIYLRVLDGRGDFVRPVCEGQPGHPVLIRNTLFDYIMHYEGEGGLKGAAESSGRTLTDIETGEPDILLDADTPEDYRRSLVQYDIQHGFEGRLHPEITLKIAGDEVICGDGFAQVMELVLETGSLQNAAAAMHMSYTRIWKIVKSVESQCHEKLIDREAGGERGGGSHLTEKGMDFLKRYKAMRKELDAKSAQIFERHFSDFTL